MKILSHLKYSKGEIELMWDRYGNGNTALIGFDPSTGERVITFSVNLGFKLPPDKMLVKDYSENEGALKTLELAGVVKTTGEHYQTEYVTVPEVEILRRE